MSLESLILSTSSILTWMAYFDPVYEAEYGAANLPAILEFTTICPPPTFKKCCTIILLRCINENTLRSNSSLSTAKSILCQMARCDLPALLIRTSSYCGNESYILLDRDYNRINKDNIRYIKYTRTWPNFLRTSLKQASWIAVLFMSNGNIRISPASDFGFNAINIK